MDVDKKNGFYVAAALKNITDNSADIATVTYDADRRAWQVKLTTPKDNSKQYKIAVHLLCGGNKSQCITEYGYGSKIDKTIPIQVR